MDQTARVQILASLLANSLTLGKIALISVKRDVDVMITGSASHIPHECVKTKSAQNSRESELREYAALLGALGEGQVKGCKLGKWAGV